MKAEGLADDALAQDCPAIHNALVRFQSYSRVSTAEREGHQENLVVRNLVNCIV